MPFTLVLLASILLQQCAGHHILVTGTTESYGLWNQLLHVSKELLSRTDSNGNPTNFITFMITQDRDSWLDTIREQNYNTSSYQIIFVPSEPKLDALKIRDAPFFEKVTEFANNIVSASFNVAPILKSYLTYSHSDFIHDLSLSQLNVEMNQNLTHKHNDVSSIKFDPVDVCLSNLFGTFPIYLCNAFNIPTIIRNEAFVIPVVESYNFWDTWLYYNNIFVMNSYPDLINGTIFTSYSQRLVNVLQQTASKFAQKLIGTFLIRPKIDELNEELKIINKSVDTKIYSDGIFGVWSNSAIIHSLGPPFATIFYQRPRIKGYSFLLYPPKPLPSESELSEWINNYDTPILYISMGSVHLLPDNTLENIYNHLINHSIKKKYRVLWALRQNIYENITNDKLEKEHFKIKKWIPQLQVLQHPKVKIFFTHSGGNGIVEGLYSKTPMIVYPRAGDQFFNAKRTVELECGLMINDRNKMSDLTIHIETLLTEANYKKNVEKTHKMLLQNGGIKEAADFIEQTSEFGIQHLLCTLGHKYPCNERIVHWYQQTMLDIYLIVTLLMVTAVYLIKRCCCRKGQDSMKQKTE